MDWLQIYFAIFIVAFSLTMVLTPLCQRLAAMTGYMDIPKSEKHKLHRGATPLLGGLAMFSAWLLTIGTGIAASQMIRQSRLDEVVVNHLGGISRISVESFVLCLCAFLALVLGMIDDKYPMKAGVKFLGQLGVAVIAVTWGGMRISLFLNSSILAWAVSVFWILFLLNAINFFDNMDGLLAGTAAIAFSFFAAAAIINRQYYVANLAVCSAAVTYGFWFYNHSPAAIFMGDGGSHFIGFLLAAVSTKVTYFNPDIAASRFSVLIPLFILAVPIFDACTVVMIRIYHHKPIYIGDHNHISHRFLHMGMNRERAVLLVHLLCLTAGLGALPLLWGDPKTSAVLLVQGLVILLFLTILQFSGRMGEGSDATPSQGKQTKGSTSL